MFYMPGRFCRNSLLFIELEKWQCTRKLRQSCRENPKVQMLQRIASADESGESRRWCCIGSHSSSMVLSTTKNAMRCFQMPSWSAWRRATSKIRSGQANQMDQQQDRQVTKFWNEKISKTTTYAHTDTCTNAHTNTHAHIHTRTKTQARAHAHVYACHPCCHALTCLDKDVNCILWSATFQGCFQEMINFNWHKIVLSPRKKCPVLCKFWITFQGLGVPKTCSSLSCKEQLLPNIHSRNNIIWFCICAMSFYKYLEWILLLLWLYFQFLVT